MSEPIKPTGPDVRKEGVPFASLQEGKPFACQADGEALLLVRRGERCFAVAAGCTHYGAPLAEGLVEGDTLRCPWHHARFDLATGEAVGPPALNALGCFQVEQRAGRVFLGPRLQGNGPGGNPVRSLSRGPVSVAIVGAGAAGTAAAEQLRREGYEGPITLFAPEPSSPVDRPNLSKDYLAGSAPEEWIPLRSEEDLLAQKIELRREPLTALHGTKLHVGERTQQFGAVLLATGASPIRLDIPGAERAHLLRTLDDSRALIAAAKGRVVIIGASFVGLEVAASMVARGLEVHVIGRETSVLSRVLGPHLGGLVRSVHEKEGVQFHLGVTPTAIDANGVVYGGGRVDGDLVVMGVGVEPNVALAEQAGLALDRGVLVDDQFRTSVAGIWAAGDVARYPSSFSGERVRIEHWVVAQQQGQHAALSMLGKGKPFVRAPFFWSQHHDLTIGYVGHAAAWDRVDVTGDVAGRDAAVAYRRGGKTLAVAAVGRDVLLLEAEAALERHDEKKLAQLVPPS